MKRLLAFLRQIETGHADGLAYETIIGNNEAQLPKRLTKFTVGELLADQRSWPKRFGTTSGAAGAYQIINATLKGLVSAGIVHTADLFDIATQDKLGAQLVRERGYESFIRGTLSATKFGNNLAKEWASMPCLSPTKRGAITLKRGQSYYDRIAGNSALVKPEAFEAVLKAALADTAVIPTPTSTTPEPIVATEVVQVKSSVFSKINWTMALGVIFNTLALFGFDIPADVRVQIMAVGSSGLFIVGYILRTFFTTTITPSSAKKV